MQYKVLNSNTIISGGYTITPIREKDIELIRNWRNEQINILRQNKFLTKTDQKNYFDSVIVPSFKSKFPEQILFSLLYNNKPIGYGGLVHIDWNSKVAEISFLLETKRNKQSFGKDFSFFLSALKKVAFQDLKLFKISSYAYDIRPHLYTCLEDQGFRYEARIRDCTLIEHVYRDVVIHSMFFNQHNPSGYVLVTSISGKVPLIRILSSEIHHFNLDLAVAGSDMSANIVSKKFLDLFIKIPPNKYTKRDEILKLLKKYAISHVIPTRDMELDFWSQNKKFFESGGIEVMISDKKVIDITRDKLKFWLFLSSHNLPGIFTTTEKNKVQGEKIVIKSRLGSGSKGVILNVSKNDSTINLNELTDPVFQPYIEGEEFSVDAYVDRYGNTIDLVVRTRKLIISGESKISNVVIKKKIDASVISFLKTLKPFGHVIVQVIVDKDLNIHIIECNCRFGGASTLSIKAGMHSLGWFLLGSSQQKVSQKEKKPEKLMLEQIRISEDTYGYS